MLLCVTEMNTRAEIDELAEALAEIAGLDPAEYGVDDLESTTTCHRRRWQPRR